MALRWLKARFRRTKNTLGSPKTRPWRAVTTRLDSRTIEVHFEHNEELLSAGTWIKLIKNSSEFRTFYLDTLFQTAKQLSTEASLDPAVFWECRPMSVKSLEEVFTFVLVDAPSLRQLRADSSAFSEHLAASQSGDVIDFSNLRGDAHLVVPAPVDSETDYAHLISFLRTAPTGQQHAIMTRVAQMVELRLKVHDQLWLSTSGLGVSWLHIRLDSRPKYYRHEHYRSPC